MSECDALDGCPFFHDRMRTMPAVAALVKQRYCLGQDHSQCARYLVRTALGRGQVPADLFPDQLERAQQLIGAKTDR